MGRDASLPPTARPGDRPRGPSGATGGPPPTPCEAGATRSGSPSVLLPGARAQAPSDLPKSRATPATRARPSSTRGREARGRSVRSPRGLRVRCRPRPCPLILLSRVCRCDRAGPGGRVALRLLRRPRPHGTPCQHRGELTRVRAGPQVRTIPPCSPAPSSSDPLAAVPAGVRQGHRRWEASAAGGGADSPLLGSVCFSVSPVGSPSPGRHVDRQQSQAWDLYFH